MTKNKHDHTATKKIKAWLFAIMLLLPFLFLLPTGLYYGLNQNAQLSERTEQQPVYYQSNEVNSFADLIVGNIYTWTDNYTNTSPTGTEIILTLENNETLITDYGFVYDSTGESRLVVNQQGVYITYRYTNYTNNLLVTNRIVQIIIQNVNNTTFDAQFYTHISRTDRLVVKDYLPVTISNDISTSIINAWNSTWQNPLFSWTTYSPFYAPMQSFTNVFGINDMQIANVLTYLATITAIYIVFDIVIELFTYLTHLIPRSD